MIIAVAQGSGASVADEAAFTSFAVTAWTDDAASVADAMGDAGRMSDQSGHVWVSAAWIRETVGGDVAWHEGFDAMVDFARSKSWLDDDGTHILAHIEVA